MKVLIVSCLLFCSVELGSGIPVYAGKSGIGGLGSFREFSPFSEQLKAKTDSLSPHELHNDLVYLHPAFRNGVILFIADCKKEGIDLMIVETYRSGERQDLMKKTKRSTLTANKSKHQHGLALDVVPVVNGKLQWHDQRLWYKIGLIGEKHGLMWGGRWKRFKDYPHFEYNCNISEIDDVIVPNKVIIPI